MQQLAPMHDTVLDRLASSPPTLLTQLPETGQTAASVLLVLRSQLLREGLKRLLTEGGFVVSREAASPAEAASLLQPEDGPVFDFVIIDAGLCGEASGLQHDIRAAFSETKIVILADEQNMELIGANNLVDADGILSSEISPEAMIQALRLIQLGERVAPSELIIALLRRNFVDGASRAQSQTQPLIERDGQSPTPREKQILRCLLLGYSNKVIARQLGITEATVKVHVKGVLRKIRASNRTQAAIWAVNNGIESFTQAPHDSINP
jgi:two-component system, NarL family, nitrate/nitrite response regulator NarL